MIDESLRPAVRLKPFLRILPFHTFDSAKRKNIQKYTQHMLHDMNVREQCRSGIREPEVPVRNWSVL